MTLLLKVRPSVARWIELGVPTHPDHAWIYGAGSWGVHEPRVFGTEVATGSGATDGALSR